MLAAKKIRGEEETAIPASTPASACDDDDDGIVEGAARQKNPLRRKSLDFAFRQI